MARSQAPDEETASGMKGSCEYTECAVAASRQRVVLQVRDWARC
jgi:hypothetical protein